MSQKIFFSMIPLLLFAISTASRNPHSLDDTATEYEIDSNLLIFADTLSRLPPEAVTAPDNKKNSKKVSRYLHSLSFIILLTLFSLLLADMINMYKRERKEARKQALADLDEKLKLKKEKAELECELEQSRKMGTIGRLLSGVAHDMNNFLAPITGYALLLRKGCRNDAILHRHAEHLLYAANRLNDLWTTLVVVSRNKTSGLKNIPLNGVIERTGSLLKHSSPAGVSVRIITSPDDPVIAADEAKLHGALLNIGINAIDSLPEGGSVSIITGIQYLDSSHHALTKYGVRPGTYAFITMQDNGIGKDRGTVARMFDPFFTPKINGKGPRLGLADVYTCIKEHNGCIAVESEPGKGSVITLYFPSCEKIAEQQVSNDETCNAKNN